MQKHGKSSNHLFNIKKSFFQNNDELLKQSIEYSKKYKEQPVRLTCKNCNEKLSEIIFTKFEIDYFLCQNCGHISGGHEDTVDFCNSIYANDKGADYAKRYNHDDLKSYQNSVNTIYLPKAQFLIDALNEEEKSVESLSFLDIGAGSGYFLSALNKLGLDDISGFEVSETQVQFANKMNNSQFVKLCNLHDIKNIISNTKHNVISLIGVLEHLHNPIEILHAIRKNPNIKYLFISVPMFSPTIFFELSFPNIMSRHLGEGHTHLYTENSLDWICKEYGFTKISEWWFGLDMMDLFRSIDITLSKKFSKTSQETWNKIFSPLIDGLQLEIDKHHLSSECHMIFKVIN